MYDRSQTAETHLYAEPFKPEDSISSQTLYCNYLS